MLIENIVSDTKIVGSYYACATDIKTCIHVRLNVPYLDKY